MGQWRNSDLGELALRLRDDTLTLVSGPYRSRLLPQLAEDGSVAGYLLVDPPLSGFPPQMTFTFEGADDDARVVMTTPADAGDPDLVYVYTRAGDATTPTP